MKKVVLTLRIPERLHTKLEILSKILDMSMNSIANTAIKIEVASMENVWSDKCEFFDKLRVPTDEECEELRGLDI